MTALVCDTQVCEPSWPKSRREPSMSHSVARSEVSASLPQPPQATYSLGISS